PPGAGPAMRPPAPRQGPGGAAPSTPTSLADLAPLPLVSRPSPGEDAFRYSITFRVILKPPDKPIDLTGPTAVASARGVSR
ncbi:MAG: hypothetical protein D6693_02440, partial [Planctomycetota bacterium]